MTRIYIAGPMSGLQDLNYPLFNLVATKLRAEGYHVENPAENPEPPCKSWAGYMRMAIAQLATCDEIALLPGWQRSKGAWLEHVIAHALGMRKTYLTSEAAALPQPHTLELS